MCDTIFFLIKSVKGKYNTIQRDKKQNKQQQQQQQQQQKCKQ